jgi:hypothetical protein
VGDVLTLKYHPVDASRPSEHKRTEIRHITPGEGRFEGHMLLGIAVLENISSTGE